MAAPLALAAFITTTFPTPGAENGTGYYGYAQNPTLSLPGGEYKGEIEVTINVPEGTVVYYTLDSSIPRRKPASDTKARRSPLTR